MAILCPLVCTTYPGQRPPDGPGPLRKRTEGTINTLAQRRSREYRSAPIAPAVKTAENCPAGACELRDWLTLLALIRGSGVLDSLPVTEVRLVLLWIVSGGKTHTLRPSLLLTRSLLRVGTMSAVVALGDAGFAARTA
jgi:hypothetical protein